jgi:hypothetical protein
LELLIPVCDHTEVKLSDGEIFRIAARVAEILAKKPEPKEPEKPKTKYKVGDEVVIRKDLEVENKYGMEGDKKPECCFAPKMDRHVGKKATITKVTSTACGFRYDIDLDDGDFYWTDEMFAGLASEMPKMARLDKVFPMPDHCFKCPIGCGGLKCVKKYEDKKRPDGCPLVEVPR